MRKKPIILVTALKMVESPQSGFGIARSLHDAGYKVVGLDDTALTSAQYDECFWKVYSLPSLSKEDKDKFLKGIKRIKAETDFKIIIPGYDQEVFFFNKIRRDLENLGTKLLIPIESSLIKTSKPFLPKLEEINIKSPETFIVKNEQEVKNACRKLGFPLVCKGLIKDAYVANSINDALIYFDKIREMWSGGKGVVLLQKFIAGQPFTVVSAVDENHRILGSVVMKKLGIDAKGTTWFGHMIENDGLINLSDKIIKYVEWVGGIEIEFLQEYKTGEHFVFEINPRFPSWVYATSKIGQNLPAILVKSVTGEAIKPLVRYKDNMVFVRIARELVYPYSDLDKALNMSKKFEEREVKNDQESKNGK